MAGIGHMKYKDKLLLGPPVDGSTQYTKETGIDVSEANYTVVGEDVINSIILTAGSGNIDVGFEGGGRAILPVTVSSGDIKEILRGWRVKTIYTGTTTFSGYIYPSL